MSMYKLTALTISAILCGSAYAGEWAVANQRAINACVLVASSGVASYVWQKHAKPHDRAFRKSTPEELERDRIYQQGVRRYATDPQALKWHACKQWLYKAGTVVIPLAGAVACALAEPASSDWPPLARLAVYGALSSGAACVGRQIE